MAIKTFIYQNQGRLKIILDTKTDLIGVYEKSIEYKTPAGTEVVTEATLVPESTSKIYITIVPLENEYGAYQFQSRVIFNPGELPVLGRPITVMVLPKWSMSKMIK